MSEGKDMWDEQSRTALVWGLEVGLDMFYGMKNTTKGSDTCISWPTATLCVLSPLQKPSDVGKNCRKRYLS